MKAKTKVGLALTVALGLALGAGQLWSNHGRDSDVLALYGNVNIREVQLGFRVTGRLATMEVDEGHMVASGDPLARLDPGPYIQGLQAADARVLEASAYLEGLKAGSRPQEIAAAKAFVKEAEATLINAEQNLHRQKELIAEGASSVRSLDAAQAARDQAAAAAESALSSLDLAREGARAEDIAAAKAALWGALSQRDQAQIQVDDTVLYAPSPGVISTRAREPGAMVGAGDSVLTLSLDQRIDIRAYVAGPDLGRVVPGTSVLIYSDSRERAYAGTVGFVSPRAEFTPKSVETPELRTDLVYRVRIGVDDPDSALRQGMPVTVQIPTEGS